MRTNYAQTLFIAIIVKFAQTTKMNVIATSYLIIWAHQQMTMPCGSTEVSLHTIENNWNFTSFSVWLPSGFIKKLIDQARELHPDVTEQQVEDWLGQLTSIAKDMHIDSCYQQFFSVHVGFEHLWYDDVNHKMYKELIASIW